MTARATRGGPRKRLRRAKRSPYRFRKFLCTASEWRFFRVLHEAVGEEYDIVPQVPVGHLLEARPGRSEEKNRRRVSQKSFDFCLLAPGSSRVIAAIELDDKSHERPERKKRDRFLDRIAKRAGLPLIRIRVRREYRPAEIRRAIETGLQQESGGRPQRKERESA